MTAVDISSHDCVNAVFRRVIRGAIQNDRSRSEVRSEMFERMVLNAVRYFRGHGVDRDQPRAVEVTKIGAPQLVQREVPPGKRTADFPCSAWHCTGVTGIAPALPVQCFNSITLAEIGVFRVQNGGSDGGLKKDAVFPGSFIIISRKGAVPGIYYIFTEKNTALKT